MFFEIKDPNYEKLPFLITTIGSQAFQPSLARPEGASFHHFLYVTAGEGLFTLQDRQLKLHKNQGIFTRQKTPITYEATGDVFSTAWLTFRGSGAEAMLDYYNIGDYLIFDASDHMIAALTSLKHSIRQKNIAARSADGYAFVLNLFEQVTLPSSEWSRRVVQINQYMESHFNEPITLDDLADHIGVDKFSICQHYKQLTGITVMNKLRSIRIQQAKAFLSEGHSALYVCQVCGFESPSYFGKIFKSVTGMTPGEYRQRNLIRSAEG